MKILYITVTLCAIIGVTSSCTEAILTTEELPADSLVTYQPIINNLMLANCTGCHGLEEPSAGLSLVTYEQVREATENGNLIARINDSESPMPPDGLMPLVERELIQQWALDNYPEN